MPRPASVSLRWRSFYGRGWITQAALLKTAHRAVFAPSSATGPQLFESTRMKTQTFCKQKPASVSLRWRSFYGRGWITQAALLKTAHRAVFAPSSATGPQLFESTRLASGKVITKQKLQYPVRILEFLVGAGGFEPPKLKSSRFTVCPHWPLGNTPIFFSQSVPDCLYILPLPRGFVKFFAANYFAGMRAASSQKKNTRTLNGFRCPKWSW